MMPPSVRPSLAFAILIAAGLLAGALMLRFSSEKSVGNSGAEFGSPEAVVADVRQDRVTVKHGPTAQAETNSSDISARAITTGVEQLPVTNQAPLPQLSGYVVDRFDDWKTIPEGYASEGIVVENGMLTLAGDPASTAPRSGYLRSPALPLRAPALAGPVDNPAPLPDGAMLHLQISLSSDGNDWSPWVSVSRYHKPDGKLATPPMQASIAKADLVAPDLPSSGTISGPSIRYRLDISASGVIAPSVADIRVWKLETW